MKITILLSFFLFLTLTSFSQKLSDRLLFIPGTQTCDTRNELTNTHYLGYGVDLTLALGTIPNELSDWPVYPWISIGAEFIKEGQPTRIYTEGGIWFVLNWGIGYSMVSFNGEKENYLHYFIGFPLPIPLQKKENGNPNYGLLLEPYLRLKANEKDYVELGMLVKLPLRVKKALPSNPKNE